MKHVALVGAVAGALVMAGCGGNGSNESANAVRPIYAAAASAIAASGAASDTATFTGKRSDYTIEKSASGYTVTDSSSNTTTSISGVSKIRFSDITLNLAVGDKAKTLSSTDLKTLIELYVAFFNRVPDADGLAYWIDQLKAGQTVDQISDSFYSAAVVYSSLTGYSSTMSNSDFVKVIYKNVLGRTGSTAPTDTEVAYWANELSTGHATKGSLIRTMLSSAHSFSGNTTWGWVPQLLDNKVEVANQFAVQQGLNYNSSEDSISKTMAIAAAVTSTDTSAAKSLVASDSSFNLVLPVVSGVAAKGPLNNATVNVYSLNADGSRASTLASTTTSSNDTGKFAVALPVAPVSAVEVEVSGGSYVSPYSGKTVSSTAPISAVVSSVASTGTTSVSVNPVTHMSTGLAKTYMNLGYSAAQSIQSADTIVQWQYGLQASPASTIPKFEATAVTADPGGTQLGLILTAIDTLGNKLAPSNPDAISTALATDYADGVLDGKYGSKQVNLAGSTYTEATMKSEFLKSVALSHSANAAGLRPGYVEAQYKAGTLTQKYEASVVPVYVAKEITPYYSTTLTTQIPNTSSFDASATGYSCTSGATVTFDSSGKAQCGSGSSYYCLGSAQLVTNSAGKPACSDGSIALYKAAEIPVYTAPIIKAYSATSIKPQVTDLVVGKPSSGTLPVYTATTLHVFTEAERAAMMAADQAAGDMAASKVSGMALNQAQVDAYRMINNAIFVSSGNFVYR